ncbi:DUF4190 domain-containing protein [Nocardioides pacificus]
MSYNAPPPPSGYGQQSYGGGQPQGDHPKAQLSMILGIVGLVCCAPVGIAAYIIGNKTLKEIEASGGTMGGAGMAKAGKICGLIAIVLTVLSLLAFILLFATGAAVFETETSTNY